MHEGVLSLSGAPDARKGRADAREQPLCCDRADDDSHDEADGVHERDQNGGVAQLVRAHGSYPWRHWFKSSHRYQQDLALDEPMHISKQYTLQGG